MNCGEALVFGASLRGVEPLYVSEFPQYNFPNPPPSLKIHIPLQVVNFSLWIFFTLASSCSELPSVLHRDPSLTSFFLVEKIKVESNASAANMVWQQLSMKVLDVSL